MTSSLVKIGLVGKTPHQADFLRLNASSPLAHHLLRWLEEGVKALHGGRGTLPAGPTCFVFTTPGEHSALVGAFAPSTDSVGRAFPLAIFTEVPARSLAARFALLPAAFRAFFKAAAELLRVVPELDSAQLGSCLGKIPSLRGGDLLAAERARNTLLSQAQCGDLLRPARFGAHEESHYYAAHTFVTACASERHRERSRASIILDCPLAPEIGPIPWLDLANRLLRWSYVPPTFCWSGDQMRLLLALGTADSRLLIHLARPGEAGAQLWPLRTQKAAAIVQAKRALSSKQRQVLDRSTSTIEELIRALTA